LEEKEEQLGNSDSYTFEFTFNYTKIFVAPPSVGLEERVSVGVREISLKGGEVRERWGGAAKEVRWGR